MWSKIFRSVARLECGVARHFPGRRGSTADAPELLSHPSGGHLSLCRDYGADTVIDIQANPEL